MQMTLVSLNWDNVQNKNLFSWHGIVYDVVIYFF